MVYLPALSESLVKLKTWAEENACDVTFRPPASPAAVDNFAEKSALNLPDELRQTLLVMDGETSKSAGMIGNWRMMPLNEIQAIWGLLTQLTVKGAFSERKPETSPYIRDTWWHRSWIPFVSSDTGNYFCVDTDPVEPERFGQVILFRQAQPQRVLVAANLRKWFDRIVRDLHAGLYTYDPETGFNGEAFMWSSLEGKHIFDDIQGKLVVTKT